MDYQSQVLQGSQSFPKPQGETFAYGTAGFRGEATKLPSVLFRCGILAALRSVDCNGATTGIMVTASHNPEQDNGVKFVEPTGEMLNPAWEILATELAAQETHQDLLQKINQIIQKIESHNNNKEQSPLKLQISKVCIGHDTRPSSHELVQAAIQGAKSMGATVFSWGLCTTPEFHFRVLVTNLESSQGGNSSADYVRFFCDGFVELVDRNVNNQINETNNTVYVDCANGVGGVRLQEFTGVLQNQTGLNVELRNTGEGVLNHLVGSDFVEKELKLPQNFQDLPSGFRGCSIDGDADRLVYFTTSPNGGITLFNGDKIAALVAYFIQTCLSQIPELLADFFRIGVVQTAYANGASTHFLKDQLGMAVVCAKTGVKHLHHEALAFDVGIYFEANGHGTVLFSTKYKEILDQVQHQYGARQLLALYKTVNQAVGDAISGILMVEGILAQLQWSMREWNNMYTDLPSKQLKVKVQDRTKIVTTPQETRCLQPPGLQEEIDQVVGQFQKGRAFARPSGTEDVVRIYAEAESRETADELAIKVAQLIYQFADGVGDPPSIG